MAASTLKLSPNPSEHTRISTPAKSCSSSTLGFRQRFSSINFSSSTTNTPKQSTNKRQRFSSINFSSSTTNTPKKSTLVRSSASRASDSSSFDVVIVGAGIIGLTIARHFLHSSDLSVAIVDAAVPCSGATGAGQGYIWRVHKTPRTEKWELALRSHQLWESLAEAVQNQGLDPLQALGWKKTGSLLVGRTDDDCSALKRKVEQLLDAGLGAKFLDSDELLSEEPALQLGEECSAAFMPGDCQLDARRAVAFLVKANRSFAAEGRYAEFYNEPATSLVRSEWTGEITAVQTSKSTLQSKKAVIIAAGCWSGSLVHELIKDSQVALDLPIKPRKSEDPHFAALGHLLVLENFKSLHLNHGLMEAGYVNHESAILKSTKEPEAGHDANTASISMTATMDMSGSLVLGSSRQLVGFNTEVDEFIIHRIWERAGEFFPVLKEVQLSDLRRSGEVRVGLRPYMPGGKPVIGPVPGLPKMFIAAGHEGEGLSLALGTAEMIFNEVLGNAHKVDPVPFYV